MSVTICETSQEAELGAQVCKLRTYAVRAVCIPKLFFQDVSYFI